MRKIRMTNDELLRAYEIGSPSVSEIARTYGVTIQAVYYHLKRASVQMRSNSEAHIGIQAKERNPNWRGGSYVASNGYRYIWVDGSQYIAEHRHIMETHLGRKLAESEVVHHLNHDKLDNRLENLELYASHSEHMKEHMSSEEGRRRAALKCCIKKEA